MPTQAQREWAEDNAKWEAAADYIRAGSRFLNLLKQRAPYEELKEAEEEYNRALKRFNRVRLLK